MKKLITMVVALAIMATMATTALAADVLVPSGTPGDAKATTSQTDTYKVTLTWGDMTFAYDFGTWNTGTHTWDNEKWVAAGFNGTKDKITVANHSSQPITAGFSCARDSATGGITTGTFTKVTGNLNGTLTGAMALDLCSVGGPGTPQTGATYLNLQNRPAASIGTTAAIIGTITQLP